MSTDQRSPPLATMPWHDLFQRYGRVMDELERRKQRITEALTSHQIPYALVGGQAVIAWVTTVDPDATRTTKDVDILLRRQDLQLAKQAAAGAGFDYFEVKGVGMFLDQENPSPKRGVHIVWANELVRPGDTVPAPRIEDSAILGQGQSVVSLEWLVKMKLTAWRLHDQVHLQDMIDVRLIDATWLARLPPELAARLQTLLDQPRR
jgi:hypothetical protein